MDSVSYEFYRRALRTPVPLSSTREVDRDGDTIMNNTQNFAVNQSEFTFDIQHNDNMLQFPQNPNNPSTDLPTSQSPRTSFHLPSSSSEESLASTQLEENTEIVKKTNEPTLFTPPPPEPHAWMWKCHLCNTRYPLHVTSRCLKDGHYYCSGVNKIRRQRNVKPKKRGEPCTSEFDYEGWQAWGNWKKKTLALLAYTHDKPSPVLYGCEGCNYPSECRYGTKAQNEVLAADTYLTKYDYPPLAFRGKDRFYANVSDNI